MTLLHADSATELYTAFAITQAHKNVATTATSNNGVFLILLIIVNTAQNPPVFLGRKVLERETESQTVFPSLSLSAVDDSQGEVPAEHTDRGGEETVDGALGSHSQPLPRRRQNM